MTLERARIVKASDTGRVRLVTDDGERPRARVVPREVLAAREEAAKIVAEAKATVVRALRKASNDAREHEIARLSAVALSLKQADEERAARDLDRTISVAKLLAERLIGEELAVAPARIAELAVAALEQTRGARDLRVDAHPDDVAAIRELLRGQSLRADVRADENLGRGSLVVHTDLGGVDARLEPQLERLAEVLRDAMPAESSEKPAQE